MNYIVGDIGNTCTKISILNHKFKIKKSYNIDTIKLLKKKNADKFFKKILVKNTKRKIQFTRVVHNIYRLIKKYIKKKKFRLFEVKDLKIKKILKVNIKNFNQIGADRIANTLGSYKNKNC